MERASVSSAAVAILGAGLTGMSAAFHLAEMGVPYRLFERLPHPGGHVITLEEEGFRFDRTGHLLHLRDPAMRQHCLSWIGGDYLEVERRSMIWSSGVYTRYPFQANTFGLPPQVAYECLSGFIDAYFAKEKPEPKNFEEFCKIHFGIGISKHFMIPYNTRLWGVRPDEITAAWCSRFVPLPKLEDVLSGAVGRSSGELGYNARFVYPRLGIGELSRGLAAAIASAAPIECNRAPKAISPDRRMLHFDNEDVQYDVLISTMPLPSLIELLSPAPEAIKQAASKLRCTHLYYLDIALDTPCEQPFHWIYVPEARYPFYRVGCYSHFSPAMAPPGKACLYIELADRNPPDLSALLPEVAKGLCEMGIIHSKEAIRFARLRRIDHAYVIFDHAYYPSLQAIRPYVDEARIVPAGRYGGWNYSSMEDALIFGKQAAEQAAAMLSGLGSRV